MQYCCDSTLYTRPFVVDPPVVIKARGSDGKIVTPIRTTPFRELGPTVLYKQGFVSLGRVGFGGGVGRRRTPVAAAVLMLSGRAGIVRVGPGSGGVAGFSP